uniref:Mnd1 HTH domain-containing protein n=1 Tax=Oryctolagus cuniculus TaxID=9986 RepID=A0A5F9DUK1_RABIT
MSKMKGLSAKEKKTHMMEIFFEKKTYVFQRKDMEKIAPKENSSLVDDGVVDCERIGTSSYYWAFPRKALHARNRKVEVLESQLSEGNQKYANHRKTWRKLKLLWKKYVKQIK